MQQQQQWTGTLNECSIIAQWTLNKAAVRMHGAGKQKQHTSGLGAAAKACAMANDGAAAAAPTSAACVSSCCCNLVADLPE